MVGRGCSARLATVALGLATLCGVRTVGGAGVAPRNLTLGKYRVEWTGAAVRVRERVTDHPVLTTRELPFISAADVSLTVRFGSVHHTPARPLPCRCEGEGAACAAPAATRGRGGGGQAAGGLAAGLAATGAPRALNRARVACYVCWRVCWLSGLSAGC